ncbi:MAG: transglycosylase SLT domain-containing protein [Proteobacteria bacterium]|nr:transglycosylase SLT domain-containing protein [Pseudomonadota bacterium]
MRILHILWLSSLLWLAGCATTNTSGDVASNNRSSSSDSSHFPSGPLSPITAGAAKGRAVAGINAPADLWDRMRRGFAMPDLDNDLVHDREQWYATRPEYMQRMTERSSKYLFHIVEELERRGMPTELALLPYIESAFNPQAVSSAKAAGMWQFMPATGSYFDLKQNVFRDDRRDVLASTRAALDYLQKLYGMFGDWHLALAAYNWGEGSVARAIARNEKAGLGTGYTDLSMPAETRMYVPKLQAVKNIVADPARFNTELPLINNHPYFQSVDITRDIDVSLVANLAGIRVEDFRALNPSLHKPVILAAGVPQVLLPWDNAQVFRKNLEARSEAQNASWTVWTVPSTMSVSAAAQHAGMSEAELRELNGIPPRMLIKAGSALMVPRASTTRSDVSGHVADNGQIAFTPEIVTRRTTVRAGKRETVASIAHRYKVSAADVADWNDLKVSSSFRTGERVIMYLPVRLIATAAARSHAHSRQTAAHTVAVAHTAKAGVSTSHKSSTTHKGGTPSKRKR